MRARAGTIRIINKFLSEQMPKQLPPAMPSQDNENAVSLNMTQQDLASVALSNKNPKGK